MPSLISELRSAFLCFGEKKVSKTDVDKDAYVLNEAQKKVMKEAGLSPGKAPDIPMVRLHRLISEEVVDVSYYGSVREGSGRPPEQRIGRIKGLLNVGDLVFLATDGARVFFCLLGEEDKDRSADQTAVRTKIEKVFGQFDPKKLAEKARSAAKIPRKRNVSTTAYERSPEVVAYTQKRSNYGCEINGCGYEGFVKEDGARYIEVHHVQPLAEGGEDSIDNTVATCPNCHRKLHYSKDKVTLARFVRETVMEANRSYQKMIGATSD